MNSFNDPFVVDPLSFSQIQWEQLNQSLFASTPAADSSSLSSLSSPASLHMDPHQQHPTQPQHASFDPLSSPYISYPPLPSSTQLLNPSEQSSYDLPSVLSEQGIRATAEGIFLPANHELGAFMSWEQVRLLFQSEEVVRRVGTLMVNQGHNQSPGAAQSPLEQGSPYAGSTGYQDLSPLSSMAGTSSVPPSGPTQSSFLTPWRSSSTADQRARSCSPSHLSPGAGSASLMGLVGGLGGPSPGMGGNDSMFNHHSSSSSTISSTAPAPLSSKPVSAGPAGLSKKKKPSLPVVPPPKAPPHLDVLPSTEPLIFYWDTSNGAPVAGSSASELMTAGGLREGLMEIRLSAGSYWRVFEKGSGEEVWPFTGKGPGFVYPLVPKILLMLPCWMCELQKRVDPWASFRH
ncbi:hypothetical protein BT69DRAFT_11587 [Atractiella rhizophila]|nr:hypothetical protein BT69DRAFT_11587 [Atractiella rhizophila]